MKWSLKNHRVPIGLHIEITRDQNQNTICNSSFCRNLLTHSHKSLTGQSKIVQPLTTEPFLSYTLQIEKPFFYFYPRRNITIKKLFSEPESNHRFVKALNLEQGTLVLHRNIEVKLMSSGELQPLQTGPNKNMRRIPEKKLRNNDS